MTTEKQLLANRANALKSTGPKTEEGKKHSSLNSLRHGLTAQVTIMTDKDRAGQEQFVANLVTELGPQSHNENQLAHAYATYQWRLNRIAIIEENALSVGRLELLNEDLDDLPPAAQDAICQAQTFFRDAPKFNTLSLYEQRMVNSAGKVIKQFLYLQALRSVNEADRKLQESRTPAAAPAPPPPPDPFANETWEQHFERAMRCYNNHIGMSKPFDAQANGFVCSTADIENHILNGFHKYNPILSPRRGRFAPNHASATKKMAA